MSNVIKTNKFSRDEEYYQDCVKVLVCNNEQRALDFIFCAFVGMMAIATCFTALVNSMV